MKPRQPNYKNDFRNIREILKTISEDISNIKKILGLESENDYKIKADAMYPWHLPNTTTSADYENED